MKQEAPDPEILYQLVEQLEYKDWHAALHDYYDREQGSAGLTLVVTATVPDTYHPERMIGIRHLFPVPPAAYDERSWRRWLLDRCLDIEQHEACEFFKINGERIYAPHHGPGNNPYTIFEHGTDEDVRTSNAGVVKDD